MIEQDKALVRYSEFWDENWYLSQYKDISKKGVDPLIHFVTKGYKENRNPSSKFDTKRYRALYETGDENPLVHFEKIGKYKGVIPPITEYLVVKKSKYFSRYWYKKRYLKGNVIKLRFKIRSLYQK